MRAARACEGVLRIALIGSIATPKPLPKDAHALVTMEDGLDLGRLAMAGRRLKGTAQTKYLGADIFLADVRGDYTDRICGWRECKPRVLCHAQHCGRREHLNDDLHVVSLSRELIAPVELWPEIHRRVALPADVEALLLGPLACAGCCGSA
jgi:hypothetical protein